MWCQILSHDPAELPVRSQATATVNNIQAQDVVSFLDLVFPLLGAECGKVDPYETGFSVAKCIHYALGFSLGTVIFGAPYYALPNTSYIRLYIFVVIARDVLSPPTGILLPEDCAFVTMCMR